MHAVVALLPNRANPRRKLKVFLIELAMAWAAQKHSVTLRPDWKLPKMRYKGDKVMAQRLQLGPKPVSARHPSNCAMIHGPMVPRFDCFPGKAPNNEGGSLLYLCALSVVLDLFAFDSDSGSRRLRDSESG